MVDANKSLYHPWIRALIQNSNESNVNDLQIHKYDTMKRQSTAEKD